MYHTYGFVWSLSSCGQWTVVGMGHSWLYLMTLVMSFQTCITIVFHLCGNHQILTHIHMVSLIGNWRDIMPTSQRVNILRPFTYKRPSQDFKWLYQVTRLSVCWYLIHVRSLLAPSHEAWLWSYQLSGAGNLMPLFWLVIFVSPGQWHISQDELCIPCIQQYKKRRSNDILLLLATWYGYPHDTTSRKSRIWQAQPVLYV